MSVVVVACSLHKQHPHGNASSIWSVWRGGRCSLVVIIGASLLENHAARYSKSPLANRRVGTSCHEELLSSTDCWYKRKKKSRTAYDSVAASLRSHRVRIYTTIFDVEISCLSGSRPLFVVPYWLTLSHEVTLMRLLSASICTAVVHLNRS